MDFVAKEVCPDGNVTNTPNNELACDCGVNFLLNTTANTCDLKPICGVGGDSRAKCGSKNALCVTQENKVGSFNCECPIGKMKNDTDSTNWKYIHVCDFEGPEGAENHFVQKYTPLVIKQNYRMEPIRLLTEANFVIAIPDTFGKMLIEKISV